MRYLTFTIHDVLLVWYVYLIVVKCYKYKECRNYRDQDMTGDKLTKGDKYDFSVNWPAKQ